MRGMNAVLVSGLIAGALLLSACATSQPADGAALPNVAGQTWDYVVLGSSIGTWWHEEYGKLVESDLGVRISYHYYFVANQVVVGLLRNVTDIERLRNDIKGAELITIGIGHSDMSNAILIYGADGQNDSRRMAEEAKGFRKNLDAVLREVVSLAQPTAVIRLMDFYYPWVQEHKRKDIWSTTKIGVLAFNDCIVQAGRRYGIPTARVFRAFHGPSGDEDPAEQGYLAYDGRHPSDKGKAAIAEEFRKLGYRPARR